MPSILSNAPRASFDGHPFPFLSRSATLEARHHVHEYPNMAGGSVEKLGRKLWTFTFRCPFHDGNPLYPDLYPDTLDTFTSLCETLTTATLVIPEIGELRCLLTKIDRERQGRILSGEEVTLTFLEENLRVVPSKKPTLTKATLATKAQSLQIALIGGGDFEGLTAQIDKYREPLGSLLDCLNALSAIRDQLDLYGQRAQALMGQIKGLGRQVHDTMTGVVVLTPLCQLLRDIWDAANTVTLEANAQTAAPLRPYVVPRTMPVGGIAQAVYGNAARGPEVLAQNPDIRDPFAVPAGTRLLLVAA